MIGEFFRICLWALEGLWERSERMEQNRLEHTFPASTDPPQKAQAFISCLPFKLLCGVCFAMSKDSTNTDSNNQDINKIFKFVFYFSNI